MPTRNPLRRARRALRVGASVATAILGTHGLSASPADAFANPPSDGDAALPPTHLRARPSVRGSQVTTAPVGLHRLDTGSRRDGWFYVPTQYDPARAMPLLVALHGAGGTGRSMLPALIPLAESMGVIVLAPDSRESTWDVIASDFGPDVRFIDRALERVFRDYHVDPSHIALSGFSDGASYALSLGLANGGLFGWVLAFSPGFVAPAPREGSPRVFIAHGTRDAVLAIDRCSQRIVPRLRSNGYEVTYREFDGPHTVRAEDVLAAVRLWLGR